jgi:DNA-binding CsgD family transcriptional regulator
MLVLGLRAAADLAEFNRARGDRSGGQAARAAVDRIVAALDRMGGRPFLDHPYLVRIPADYASWSAEVSRFNGASDADAWESVAGEWQRLQRPHRMAYALWRSAEAHAAAGHLSVAALRQLKSAAAAAAGMVPLVSAITRLARRARVPLDAVVGDATPATTASAPVVVSLTERERQVLWLVCEGRTNSQIGAELYISPKTASVHVMHILRKLDVANRTQAAAVAERLGIFDELESI